MTDTQIESFLFAKCEVGGWDASTYRAVEISSRVFLLGRKKVAVPAPDRCVSASRLAVMPFGCGNVEAQFPNLSYPRVPGHEVIGRIEEGVLA